MKPRKNVILFVCASFVWLMTELQQKKRNSLPLSENEEKVYRHAPMNYASVFFIPPSCASGERLWEQSFSHCLAGSHMFIWRSYKRQWRKKLKITTGFSSCFVPWIGRARGEAHPISWEGNTVHFSSLCPHFTSKKISVGKLQKDHHHPPRILDMSTTYQNCENSGLWQGKRRKHWQKRSEISELQPQKICIDMY